MSRKESLTIGRVHAFYSGRVQGVGFRYTAERIALENGLVGCVKNLPDGRVELICEGEKNKIEGFLSKIKEGALGLHIKKVDCEWEKPSHKYKDFCIEFCY